MVYEPPQVESREPVQGHLGHGKQPNGPISHH